MADSKPRKGVCSTCRFYKQDKWGRYCAQNVTDRMRGHGQEPCGWWKARKAWPIARPS